jgi:cytochrome c1
MQVDAPKRRFGAGQMASRRTRAVCLVASAIALTCVACQREDRLSARFGGSPQRGEKLTRYYGCAACHVIPGIEQPRGILGPSLDAFAQRTFIAGVMPNTPENLVRWVIDPLAIDPKTAMPAVGLNHAQAQDVAAYLFTLN